MSVSQTMAKRYLRIVVINVVLFAVFAELFAIGAYYIETGAFFYLHSRTYEQIGDDDEARLTTETLHPYFGPTHQPGLPFDPPDSLKEGAATATPTEPRKTNNFGFISDYDYPFLRQNDRQFIIGMFGGSVGAWYCQLGAPRMVSRLQADPFFAGKELIPLCFSHEGYKQPQQMLLLSYFLSIGQPFDLVVNIDGFNELALGVLNHDRGFDISMPSALHLDPLINVLDRATMTPEKLRSLGIIADSQDRLNRLAERLRRNPIAAVDFVLHWYYERLLREYRVEQGRFANLPSNPRVTSGVRVTPEVRAREGAALYDDIAQQWVRASVVMNDLLLKRGVPYFHFLQPNQYHTQRRFSADEARVALSDESVFKRSIEQGYPVLTGASAAGVLRAQMRFFDATHVFDAEPAPVYMDNCCHYTLVGNHRLGEFVAASILSSTGPWRRAPPPR